LGRLHLTGATRTGTGRSGNHHNQSTRCCIGQKTEDPRKNTPFPHTINAEILITFSIPDKLVGQRLGSLNQSKIWIIKPQTQKTTPTKSNRSTPQFQPSKSIHIPPDKAASPKETNKLLQAGIKRYTPSAQRRNNSSSRSSK
jgi:hypothetical protein